MNKKPCVRCERLIDPVARLCPYCNWDQELPPPKASPITAPVDPDATDIRVRERRRKLKRVLIGAGVVLAAVAIFAIGALATQFGKKAEDKEINEIVPSNQEEQPESAARPLSDLRLVPSSDMTSTVNRSITSAPLQNPAVTGTQPIDRSDTTALPSQQYAQMAERAAQERALREREAALGVDPRTIRPPAPPRPAPRPAPSPTPAPAERQEPERRPQPTAPVEPPAESVRRTRPEPISQPLPQVGASGTARFRLRIGADGSVREVEVLRTIPGATAELVSSIQRWKFKPATENGRPVEGVHMVDLTFKGNDEN